MKSGRGNEDVVIGVRVHVPEKAIASREIEHRPIALGDGDRIALETTITIELDGDRVAFVFPPDASRQLPAAIDGLTVDSRKDIADLNAGSFGGAAFIDARHENTHVLGSAEMGAQLGRHRGNLNTDEASIRVVPTKREVRSVVLVLGLLRDTYAGTENERQKHRSISNVLHWFLSFSAVSARPASHGARFAHLQVLSSRK